MKPDPNPIYYVYILFDANAIPKWVGKGKRGRILDSATPSTRPKSGNRHKNNFLLKTLKALGEVPKLKIRENLTETDAFTLEEALIKAIGRSPNGPLTNLSDGGEGSSGYCHSKSAKVFIGLSSTRMHAAKTKEERSALALKIHNTQTPEQRSQRQIKANASRDPKELREQLCKAREAMTLEQKTGRNA
jgi:hypothetical protein